MRKMSRERRQVSVLAAAMCASSGVMPVLLRGHARAMWVWMGAEIAVLSTLIVLAVRMRLKGDCA